MQTDSSHPTPAKHGPWPPTRRMARQSKSKFYFTGLPCAHGHFAARVTSSGACTDCARIWRENNKDQASTYYKIWAAENRDLLRAYHQKWRDENREHVNAEGKRRMAIYRAMDPDKYARLSLEYYHRNMKDPEFRIRQSEASSRQYGKRKAAEGEYKQSDIELILKQQKYKCVECGASVRKRSNRHIDHVIPIVLGGTSWPSNMQILCPSCNLRKGGKHPIDFARSKGRLL